ncbi:GGDEF domain-containing protein [Spirulina subsalsa FACHB-351]|uniref:GGDEF domain-containing protein n=1 Tax=Spirulina subsalsa FACHB-351 TaxID=234711 RepID=A0ABT3L3P0_9CYAN|nr:GGDEF domain-containing protein [Spirulina subsalsa]MCW6036124.1 GGDEF domain-containing protein [Spirulina subsalsa FACHB-351]
MILEPPLIFHYIARKAYRYLEQCSERSLLLLCSLLLIGLGWLHYSFPVDISFFLFYLVPVAIVTWFIRGEWGILFGVISAVFWLASDLRIELGKHLSAHLWNMSVRSIQFAIIVYLLTAFKRAYNLEKTLARFDTLTQTVNRYHFFELLQAQLTLNQKNCISFTIAYIDLDDFKQINDKFGHQVGDNILRKFAHTIQQNIRSQDILGRLGGDEFVLLLPNLNPQEAPTFLKRIQGCLTQITTPDHHSITVSIGAATFECFPTSCDEVLEYVDQLMYNVKMSGKNNIIYEIVKH